MRNRVAPDRYTKNRAGAVHILITNDDGIQAKGLNVLQKIAAEIAGGTDTLWTVAPEQEQSGVAHAVSYINPMRLFRQADPQSFAITGTPADCVLAGIHNIMPQKPDLILSGINRGNNAAQNTLYSGTIGAAIEGALQGVKSIALSQFWGPDNRDLDDPFDVAYKTGAGVIQALLQANHWGTAPYHICYNVNFPPVPAAECKGMRAVAQGFRETADFHAKMQASPNGREFLWISAGGQHTPTAPGTDVHANLDGYISVTPVRTDLTCVETLHHLKKSWAPC